MLFTILFALGVIFIFCFLAPMAVGAVFNFILFLIVSFIRLGHAVAEAWRRNGES